MARPNISLPPLDYLLAFEAAAKCESFVGASKRLNISETAISRKVRLLELHYDVPLFLRGHRSISLTPQGISFLNRILPALEDLREASRQIVVEQSDRPVTLAATNSVASLWLMPRLQDFHARNKHVRIKLVASDSDQECLSETVDLAILRGNGDWPGYDAQLLFGETIFPVCSPDYLATHPEAADPTALSGLDLIEVSANHPEWMTWKTWLAQAGQSVKKLDQTAVFNTYAHALEAAVNGLGLALGWWHLADRFLNAGQLVRPVANLSARTQFGYYLLCPQKADRCDPRQVVQDWLVKASATRERFPAER
ncbi:MAG: LysR substrate-binding domain-containing protein [Qingshengfaniella sp.]